MKLVHISTIVKCFSNSGITVNANQPATENVVEELADFTGLLGDITIDQFTSCDDAVHTTDRAGTEWEADIVTSTRRATADNAADDDSEEEGDDEEEVPSQPAPVPLTFHRQLNIYRHRPTSACS